MGRCERFFATFEVLWFATCRVYGIRDFRISQDFRVCEGLSSGRCWRGMLEVLRGNVLVWWNFVDLSSGFAGCV